MNVDGERFRDLAIEHLLQGLEGDALREFRAEMERRGAEGERELARLREVMGSLALAAPPVDPPEALRARLVAQIEAEASEKPPTAEGPPSGDAGAGDREVTPIRPEWGRWGVAAAGLAAALAFVFGLGNVELRNQAAVMQASLDSARTALALAEGEAAAAADSLRRSLEGAEAALGIAGSRGASSVMLSGTEAQPFAWARAFIDPVTGRTLLLIHDLPVLPPDTVYQLWAIRGDTPTPAGTLTVGPAGSGRLESEDADLWLGANVLAVTVEPAPGRSAPTGPIVLAGSL
ncbi:MAG: anti-sigma factor [Gemmatimonadota bacterium]